MIKSFFTPGFRMMDAQYWRNCELHIYRGSSLVKISVRCFMIQVWRIPVGDITLHFFQGRQEGCPMPPASMPSTAHSAVAYACPR